VNLVDIGIIATLFGVCVCVYLAARARILLLEMHAKVSSIDQAVNMKPAGSATISEQIQAMSDEMPAQKKAAQKVITDAGGRKPATKKPKGGTP